MEEDKNNVLSMETKAFETLKKIRTHSDDTEYWGQFSRNDVSLNFLSVPISTHTGEGLD